MRSSSESRVRDHLHPSPALIAATLAAVFGGLSAYETIWLGSGNAAGTAPAFMLLWGFCLFGFAVLIAGTAAVARNPRPRMG